MKRSWRKAFPTPFVPKGVYRFHTHEEADAWMEKMLARCREYTRPKPAPKIFAVAGETPPEW